MVSFLNGSFFLFILLGVVLWYHRILKRRRSGSSSCILTSTLILVCVWNQSNGWEHRVNMSQVLQNPWRPGRTIRKTQDVRRSNTDILVSVSQTSFWTSDWNILSTRIYKRNLKYLYLIQLTSIFWPEAFVGQTKRF